MKPLSRPLAFLFAIVITASLHAQDITVTAPAWTYPASAPDELPKVRSKLRPDYPDEMRKTDEVGYVILLRYLDAKGEGVVVAVHGTHVPFQRAVEQDLRYTSFSPAKRGGVPVDAQIWMAAIFNPKSASTRGANATPRLLAVTPVFTKSRPTKAPLPPVVSTKFSIDSSGAITAAIPQGEVEPKAADAIVNAVKAWRFAPARQDGQPVAAEITVPVLCMPPLKTKAPNTVPPKAISQTRPRYPIALRRFGLRGEVQIDFEVDVDGSVKDAVIRSSTNPAFELPALTALREWKFQPGTHDGKPVKMHERVPIIFEIEGGRDAFEISDRVDQSKLPPEFRYDTAPKLRNVQIPVYPYPQRRDDVTGKAQVTMMVDITGRVSDIRVNAADQPEFGLALAAAVEGFQFDPALKDGKPVPHLLNFEQSFNDRELNDAEQDRLLRLEKRHPEKIVAADKLDAPLKPLSRRAPKFPVTVPRDVNQGEAVIECLIDEEGQVQLPRIVSASAPAFGYAAVQAVNSWWFEPPKRKGDGVVVRVQIPFKFEPKKAKATDAAKPADKPAPTQPSS